MLCNLAPARGRGYHRLCIATDTTALKRSELRLRRSEQLMVDTQGVAHLGTWEWDSSRFPEPAGGCSPARAADAAL